LIAAATALFVSQGFRATTVDEVAEAAGVTTGAVYSNFSGKEALLYAALDASAVVPDLSPFLDDSASPAEQLGAFLSRVTRAASSGEWQQLQRLEQELLQLAQHDAQARDLIKRADRDKRATFANWLQSEEGRGRITLGYPAEEVAAFVVALIRDLAQQHARDPREVPTRFFTDAFTALLGLSGR